MANKGDQGRNPDVLVVRDHLGCVGHHLDHAQRARLAVDQRLGRSVPTAGQKEAEGGGGLVDGGNFLRTATQPNNKKKKNRLQQLTSNSNNNYKYNNKRSDRPPPSKAPLGEQTLTFWTWGR